MKSTDRQPPAWLGPCVGTCLIVLGCYQFAYAVLLGVGFRMFLQFLELVFQKKIEPDAHISIVTTIAHLGSWLATWAVIAGILTLLNKHIAVYFTAIAALFAFLLAWCHLTVAWNGFAMLYVVIGAVLILASIVTYRLHASAAPIGPRP